MRNEKPRSYVVRERKSEDYFYGNSAYGKDLIKAKIFDFNETLGFFRTDEDAEIIFLDEEKGLELIAKERQKFSEIIDAKERELKEIKEYAIKFHQANKEMINKYEGEYFRRYNEAAGISSETKKSIIKDIISKKI